MILIRIIAVCIAINVVIVANIGCVVVVVQAFTQMLEMISMSILCMTVSGC